MQNQKNLHAELVLSTCRSFMALPSRNDGYYLQASAVVKILADAALIAQQ